MDIIHTINLEIGRAKGVDDHLACDHQGIKLELQIASFEVNEDLNPYVETELINILDLERIIKKYYDNKTLINESDPLLQRYFNFLASNNWAEKYRKVTFVTIWSNILKEMTGITSKYIKSNISNNTIEEIFLFTALYVKNTKYIDATNIVLK